MKLNKAIKRFLKAVEARGRKPRTVGSYEQHFGHLQRFAKKNGLKKLEAIKPEHMDDWVVSMRRQETRWANHPIRPEEEGGLSEATLAGRIQTAKTFFDWCVERGYLKRSPAKHLIKPDVDPSAEDKLIDPEDLKKIETEALKRARAGQSRDLAIVRFIAETGCREGEAASLRISTLKLEDCDAGVEGKTKEREVDYTELTGEALEEWIEARPDTDHDYVFINHQRKTPLTTNGIYQVFRRLARAAGVKGRHNPHAVRHLVGQRWTDKANLELARQKLGHKHITTTSQFYAHQDRSRLKQSTRELSLLKRSNDED
jgi:integrase/recombinase XerC